MEMASYWLLEKQLVHKLFKVLVPRYQTHSFSYTKMWRASVAIDHIQTPKCVLELRNNIYPPLGPEKCNHKNLIHNILLSEAKKFYYKEKALKTFVKDENLKEREAPNLSATEESLFKSSQAESHKDQIAKQCESVDNLDIDALQITESNSKKTFAPEEAGININAKTTLEKDEKVDENHSSKTDEMLKEK